MITVTMACGHVLSGDAKAAPYCPLCREVRVSRVKAPAPRFRGYCVGPTAEFAQLDPKPVRLKKDD